MKLNACPKSSEEKEMVGCLSTMFGLHMALSDWSFCWSISSKDLYYPLGFFLFSIPLASMCVKAWRRPPLHCGGTLFLSICRSLHRTITLSIFSWAIVVPPYLQKRVLFSGELFFLSCSILMGLMGFLGSGWRGFWGCKRTPLNFVMVLFFFSAHIKDMKRSQDFKAEDGLSVTLTSPNSTKEVRSEVRLWGQMKIYLLAGLYKTQNWAVIISVTQIIWIIQYSSETIPSHCFAHKKINANAHFISTKTFTNFLTISTMFVNEIRFMYVPM